MTSNNLKRAAPASDDEEERPSKRYHINEDSPDPSNPANLSEDVSDEQHSEDFSANIEANIMEGFSSRSDDVREAQQLGHDSVHPETQVERAYTAPSNVKRALPSNNEVDEPPSKRPRIDDDAGLQTNNNQ